MRHFNRVLIALPLLALPFSAMADRDDDDDHHHHRHHRHCKHFRHHAHHDHVGHPYVKTVWEGNCKVKLLYTRDGVFEEGRKCKPVYGHAVQPVPAPPPVIYPNRGVTVSGSVTLP